MQTSEPAFALETAACLWEAVLGLRDHPVTDPDHLARAIQIRPAFEAVGTATMRMIVIGWTDAVDMAWARVADDYTMSFDWDFVPDWIVRNIDWSNPGCPVVRPEPDRTRASTIAAVLVELVETHAAKCDESADVPEDRPAHIVSEVHDTSANIDSIASCDVEGATQIYMVLDDGAAFRITVEAVVADHISG